MLYTLDHADDIDQCVPVSSTIRIISDMRMRVFVGVLTWKSLLTNNIERQIVNSNPTIWKLVSVNIIYVIMLKLFSLCK